MLVDVVLESARAAKKLRVGVGAVSTEVSSEVSRLSSSLTDITGMSGKPPEARTGAMKDIGSGQEHAAQDGTLENVRTLTHPSMRGGASPSYGEIRAKSIEKDLRSGDV